jgi:hypothetical protein
MTLPVKFAAGVTPLGWSLYRLSKSTPDKIKKKVSVGVWAIREAVCGDWEILTRDFKQLGDADLQVLANDGAVVRVVAFSADIRLGVHFRVEVPGQRGVSVQNGHLFEKEKCQSFGPRV